MHFICAWDVSSDLQKAFSPQKTVWRVKCRREAVIGWVLKCANCSSFHFLYISRGLLNPLIFFYLAAFRKKKHSSERLTSSVSAGSWSNRCVMAVLFPVCIIILSYFMCAVTRRAERTVLLGERTGLTSSLSKGKPFLSDSFPAEHTHEHARAHTPTPAHKHSVNINHHSQSHLWWLL